MTYDSRLIKIGEFLTRHRMLITMLVFGLLLWEDWNEKNLPRSAFSLDEPRAMVGGILIVVGVVLRSWAAGIIKKTHTLATSGPYALTRHPLYVGSLMIAVGFSFLLWDNENIWAVLIVGLFLYVPKIRQEEKHLAAMFGDAWDAYCLRTALFFPKRRPDLRGSWSFKQWAYNREFNALLTTLAAFALLTALTHMHR